MAKRAYEHSAYWYAMNYGWTCSDKATHVERLIDETKRDLMFYDSHTGGTMLCNPVGFGVCLAVSAAMDIGAAMRETARKVADPVERDRMRRELLRDLRAIRRPFYYARETARRRALAAERRKVARRTTTAPMPSPEDVLAAWARRKESKADMIRLGGMLQDLECYVDNSLRFDGRGEVVGRNGGIRGWLRECLPELLPKYKTLMRYKAMAIRLRQATGTKDPTPTSALLGDEGVDVSVGNGEAIAAVDRGVGETGTTDTPCGEMSDANDNVGKSGMANTPCGVEARGVRLRCVAARGKPHEMHKVVRELLEDFRMTFSSLDEGIRRRVDAEWVFLDPARVKGRSARRRAGRVGRGQTREQNG